MMIVRLLKSAGYVLTLRCEEADRIRCVCNGDELTQSERWGEWLHSLLCKSCRNARRQIDKLGDAVVRIAKNDAELSVAGDQKLGEDSKARILKGLETRSD